jgi:hypothetical protein
MRGAWRQPVCRRRVDGGPQLLKVGLAGLVVSAAATVFLVSGGADGAGWAYFVSFYAMAGLSLVGLARQLRTAATGDIRCRAAARSDGPTGSVLEVSR